MSYILLNPGPVNITHRVRSALLKPDLCHREHEFSQLLQNIREKLIKLLCNNSPQFTAVLFTGSGTAALEAAIANSVDDYHSLLIINNGVYGERIKNIAQAYGLRFVELSCDWSAKPSLSDIEHAINKDDSISAIAMVHHETTTGLLNPVKDVGAIARINKKRFVVDSISGLGGEKFDIENSNVSLVISTANKCIHGLPGVSFIIIKEDYLSEMSHFPERNLYLNIVNSHLLQVKGETPFTPAVQIMYALEEALLELEEEGLENRIACYKMRSELIRTEITRLGIKPYIPIENMSNSISSFLLPAGKSYENMHDYLKQRGIIIYAGQGDLYGKIFRIANMGDISINDIQQFLSHLKTWLTSG